MVVRVFDCGEHCKIATVTSGYWILNGRGVTEILPSVTAGVHDP